MFKKIVCTQEKHTLIGKDHLGYWSLGRDCCLWLMFQQPVRKSEWSHLTLKMPSSESSHLMHRLSRRRSQAAVLLETPITQMIFSNQGELIFCCANNLKTWIDAWVDLQKMVMKWNGLQYADTEPLFCSIILIVIAVAGLKYKSQVMSLTLWPVLYKPNF